MRKTEPKLLPTSRIASPQFTDIGTIISYLPEPKNIAYCNTVETITTVAENLSCKICLFSIK